MYNNLHEQAAPRFTIGQTDGVEEYVLSALQETCQRNRLCEDVTSELRCRFLQSLRAVMPTIGEKSRSVGVTEPIAESRDIFNALGDHFVSHDSVLHGGEHFEQAQEHLKGGGNVLLVQNHQSGADNLLMETLLRRAYGDDIVQDWAYMSGHAVNIYAIPLIMTSGLRRFQIFSAKYQSMAASGGQIMQETGADAAEMNRQNNRAMRALLRYATEGGKTVVLYPEGGRGDEAMVRIEPKTTAVPYLMTKNDIPLMILPTFVSGTRNILPVTRSDNEYNEFIQNARVGAGSMTVGAPVPWTDIVGFAEDRSVIDRYVQNGMVDGDIGDKSITRVIAADTIGHLIARLAPDEQARGPYQDEKLCQFA